MTPEFTPIILGSDMNAYGMARAFHEEYGIKVHCIASDPLAPTRYSNILMLEFHHGFEEDPVFIDTMHEVAKRYADHQEPVILIAMGDAYAELLAKHKEFLQKTFVVPVVDYALLRKLNNKESFYQIAEEHGLPYPKTKIITKAMYEKKENLDVPFTYPVAFKPANSVEWLDIQFEGRKKAFVIHSETEYLDILGKIYDNGYTSDMILQEFIPGDDSNMRTLNAYVSQDHQVKLLCLGHPLLEDPTPAAIGNYVTILPEYNQDVYDVVQKFLEELNFTGYCNFDMKFDPRDNTFKFFEINLRQGRSSFFVTLTGYNLARFVVDDYVTGTLADAPTVYANKIQSQHVLWMGVPVKLFKDYAVDNEFKQQALQLIDSGRYGTTVFYKKDMNIRRWVLMKYMFHNYIPRYKKYFEENKGRDIGR